MHIVILKRAPRPLFQWFFGFKWFESMFFRGPSHEQWASTPWVCLWHPRFELFFKVKSAFKFVCYFSNMILSLSQNSVSKIPISLAPVWNPRMHDLKYKHIVHSNKWPFLHSANNFVELFHLLESVAIFFTLRRVCDLWLTLIFLY